MTGSSAIPEELIDQAERGNVVPLIGPELGAGRPGEAGLPTTGQLAAALAQRLAYQEPNPVLARLAQLYEMKYRRHALIDFLRRQLAPAAGPPSLAVYRHLARLEWQVAITTCLDDLLEMALQQAQVPFQPIVGNIDVAYEDQSRRLIVRMYGRLDQPDSLVITEMDHLRWQEESEAVATLLKGLIASRTLLILGQDLAEDYFKNIYARITLPFKRNIRRSYACCDQPSPYIVAWWDQLNVEIIPIEPAELLAELAGRLQARHRPAGPVSPAAGPAAVIPRQPYKFLMAYEADDRSIFFGREVEKWHILSKIVSFRLVVLHGPSGVGKTSLIKAGLVPELAERGYHPVYARMVTEPLATVKTFIQAGLATPLPPEASLRDGLAQAVANAGGSLVLFLDQFEELFIRDIPDNVRAEFLQALGEVYRDTSLDVKIVIGIRADCLAELTALKPHIPEIFFNDYRLNSLNPEQARRAITDPVALYNIEYEAGLVDRIVADLGIDRVDPPQLQIVCNRLYDNLDIGDRVITTELYHSLGGARAILAEYVDDVLRRYPEQERARLQLLLKEFVTADKKASLLTVTDLAHRTGMAPDEVDYLLRELETARLIRPIEAEVRFELVHEYLIPYIASWTSEEDLARKRAQAMLDQGLNRWQNYGLPLYPDELAIINAQRDHLFVSDPARGLLVHSAVWTGAGADYWLERAPAEQRDEVLTLALGAAEPDVRRRAAGLAGQFDSPGLIPGLEELVLADPSPQVRRAAVRSLARLEGGRVVTWLGHRLNQTPAGQRATVLEAIDELRQAASRETGETQRLWRELRLRIMALRWRQNQAQWLRVSLYTAVGGFGGGLAGGLIGAILENELNSLTLATIAVSALYAMVMGAGTGFGFGSVAAGLRRSGEPVRVGAGERHHPGLYVAGTALSGGLAGLLLGAALLEPAKIVWSIPIGVLSGGLTGAMLAWLLILTAPLSPRPRLWLRLFLATFLGFFTSGLVFSFGTYVDVVLGNVINGLSLGILMVTGMAAGLDLAACRSGLFQTNSRLTEEEKEYVTVSG